MVDQLISRYCGYFKVIVLSLWGVGTERDLKNSIWANFLNYRENLKPRGVKHLAQ